MTVVEITPEVDQAALLAGAQFADAFCIADERYLAECAASRGEDCDPRTALDLYRWMRLRNRLAAPLWPENSRPRTRRPPPGFNWNIPCPE